MKLMIEAGEVNLRWSAFLANDMMVEIGRLYTPNTEAAYNANRKTSNSIAHERALWQKKNPLRTGTKIIQHRQCGYLHTQMTHRYSHAIQDLSMTQRTEAMTRKPRSKAKCMVHVTTSQRLYIVFVLESLQANHTMRLLALSYDAPIVLPSYHIRGSFASSSVEAVRVNR
jgi:hypothetical protein